MSRATTTGPGAGGRSRAPGRAGGPDPSGPLGPGRATVAVLLVVVAVLLGALAGPFSPTFADRGPAPPAIDLPTPTPEPPLEDPFADLLENMPPVEPVDLTWVGVTFVALLVGVAVWALARVAQRIAFRRRGRGEPDPADVAAVGVTGDDGALPDVPTLREGVDDAGRHLGGHASPPDAVIAAWVALEDAAGRSGVVRDPAQTPTEFTVEVLDRTPADRGATRTLLDLYLRARFGDDPVGRGDVTTAAHAVQVLARSLADAPGAGGPDDGGPDHAADDDAPGAPGPHGPEGAP